MFAVFGAILVAFQYQSDLVGANRAISDAQAAKIQEQFTLRSVVSGGSCPCTFSLWIDNTGTNTIEIVDIWVGNRDTGALLGPYSISSPQSFQPPGSSVQYFASSPITLSTSGHYYAKAVSALGNMRQVQFDAPQGTGGGNNNIVDVLVAKPSVYAAFSNPLSKGGSGYFSVIIANPTKNTMTINRASLQLLSAVNPSTFGTNSAVDPNSGWNSGGNDVVYWEGSGIDILPYRAKAFTVLNTIGGPASANVPILTVNTNAWTSFGQFGSEKLDTVALNSVKDYAIPNVFLTSSVQHPVTEHLYYIPKVVGTQNFFVTVQNTGTSAPIDASATLVVNLPKGFTYTGVLGSSDVPSESVSVVPFDDESTQLRINMGSSIPNSPAALNSRTFAFSATAPAVTQTTLYVVHMYLNGYTTFSDGNTILIGAVSEPVVQVCTSLLDPNCP